MLTSDQIAKMSPAERARLRTNCETALDGPKARDARSIIRWIDEIEGAAPSASARLLTWRRAKAGHHEGRLDGTKRFDLIQEEIRDGDTKPVWGIHLDGRPIARAKTVKEAKVRAEEEAEKLVRPGE